MYPLPVALENALSDTTLGSSRLAARVALGLSALPDLVSEAQFQALARAILNRRPHFALNFHLLHSIGSNCFVPSAGRESGTTVQRESSLWLSARERARVRIALPPPGAGPLRLLTWSHSGTVLACVKRLAEAGVAVDVRCAASHPGGEGAVLASDLTSLGVPSRLVDDEDVVEQLIKSTAVVVGADAIFAHEFWNKVGTQRLMRAARDAGVPAWVVAEGAKWSHPSWGISLHSRQSQVSAESRFEAVDNQLVTYFCLDAGPVVPGGLTSVLGEPPLYAPIILAP